MHRLKYASLFAALALFAVAPLLMAPTGGFPSRPTFQTVRVGTGTGTPTVGQINASGRILAGSGSGNGYAFLGDTDTGFFAPFADAISLNVGGTTTGLFAAAFTNFGIDTAILSFNGSSPLNFNVTSIPTMQAFNSGTAGQASVSINSPRTDDTGGTFLRYYENDGSTSKGIVGFGSTTDNDLDVLNQESNANIDLATTGTGVVRSNGETVVGVQTCTTACSGAGIDVGGIILVKKGSQTDTPSDATVNADPDLQVTGLPSGNYAVELYLEASYGAGGFRYVLDVDSGGGVFNRSCTATGSTVGSWSFSVEDATCTGAGVAFGKFDGMKTTSSGEVVLRWAQVSSNAANTSVLPTSYLRIQRLN